MLLGKMSTFWAWVAFGALACWSMIEGTFVPCVLGWFILDEMVPVMMKRLEVRLDRIAEALENEQ